MIRLKQIGTFLAAGYILMFFSEFLFYAEYSPDSGSGLPALRELGMMWMVYTGMAWLTLAILRIFRARSLPAVFLAGAVYGWLLEGVIVTTVYEAIPTQIHFTAIAWHAPLDVLIGLYLAPQLLRSPSPKPMAYLSIALGVFWGFWALWPWWDTGVPLAVSSFVIFSFTNTICLILAYWLFAGTSRDNWQPSRLALTLLSGFLVVLFIFQVIPAYPYALLILPVLLGTCLLALWKNRQRELSLKISTESNFHRSYLLTLFLFPAIASSIYALCVYSGLRMPVTYLVYILSSLIGIGSFAYSVIHLLKPNRTTPVLAGESG